MVAFTLERVSAFMGSLLSTDAFDSYGVHEITIMKGFNLIIEGNQGAVLESGTSSEETEEQVAAAPGPVLYGTVRPLCFDAVKGKVLPEFMRFVLTAPAGTLKRLTAESGGPVDETNILSLALNITYRNGAITVTSGTSAKDIFAGKAVDTAWGEAVKRLFTPFGLVE